MSSGPVATASGAVEAEKCSTTAASTAIKKINSKDYEDGDAWTARTILLRQSIIERLAKVAKCEDINVSQRIRKMITRRLKRAEEI
jgi:hypothetical protein